MGLNKCEFDKKKEEFLSNPNPNVSLIPGDRPVHLLSLKELQYLSKTLLEVTVAGRLMVDVHLNYWGWVCAMVHSTVSLNKDIYDRTIHHVRDYGMFKNAYSELITATRNLNNWSYLSTIAAPSVLEGMLRRHCSSISTTFSDDDMVNLEGALDIWRETAYNGTVATVLTELNKLCKHYNSMELWEIEMDLKGVGKFAKILTKLRNSNSHGYWARKSQIGIFSTMCSLVLLDSIVEEDFVFLKECTIEDIIYSQNMPVTMRYSPSLFYHI